MLKGLWRVNRALRWRIAAEAALAVAASIGVFTLRGRTQDGLVASMGGFCVLYFTAAPFRVRKTAIPLVALSLMTAALLGGLSAASNGLNIAVIAAVAGVAATVLQGFSAGPPGALMFVLVAGVSGHIVASSSTAIHVAGLVGAGCAVTCGVALVGALLSRRSAGSGRPSVHRWALEARQLQLAARLTVAVLCSGLLSNALGIDRPYWAMATAVAILQGEAVLRAVHRLLGSFLGVGAFALVSLTHPRGWVLGGLIALFQGAGELLMAANYGLAMICITPVALLIAASVNPALDWATAEARLVDTCAGAAVAVCTAWLFPLRASPPNSD